MRHLMLIKVDAKGYEAGNPPPQELVDAMGPLMAEWGEQGIMLAAEGLRPTSEAKRLRIGKGKLSVTDGPFTEAKEVIGGFFILQTQTQEEAVALTRQFLELHARVLGPEFVIECDLRKLEG
jgi:hypothetical protein